MLVLRPRQGVFQEKWFVGSFFVGDCGSTKRPTRSCFRGSVRKRANMHLYVHVYLCVPVVANIVQYILHPYGFACCTKAKLLVSMCVHVELYETISFFLHICISIYAYTPVLYAYRRCIYANQCMYILAHSI